MRIDHTHTIQNTLQAEAERHSVPEGGGTPRGSLLTLLFLTSNVGCISRLTILCARQDDFEGLSQEEDWTVSATVY